MLFRNGLVSLVISAVLFAPQGVSASPHSSSGGNSQTRDSIDRPRPAVVACSNITALSSWSLGRLAAQLVVVPVDESNVSAALVSVQSGVGGVILLGDKAPLNLGVQLSALAMRSLGGVRPFVMTDEEGGGVQRMANLVGSIPWPRTMTMTMTTKQVRSLAKSVAQKMIANGITMNLAPVVDIASGPGPDSRHTDGPRSFSPNPMIAERFGLAFAQGMLEGGVIPVMKHFPGEGNASANTDDGPASTPPFSVLNRADLLPFKDAIRTKMPAIMVGNATVPGLASGPASLSSNVVSKFLRDQLGFKGLILTDSLSAKSISEIGISVPQAAEEAVEAGADMVLFNSTTPSLVVNQVIATIVNAVKHGSMSRNTLDNAVASVLNAKKIELCHKPGSQ